MQCGTHLPIGLGGEVQWMVLARTDHIIHIGAEDQLVLPILAAN